VNSDGGFIGIEMERMRQIVVARECYQITVVIRIFQSERARRAQPLTVLVNSALRAAKLSPRLLIATIVG